ncbi:membrane-associated ring finger C3HC4 4 [Triplophysa rosa]|uniref:Membrane-associated ring finger C3HC4 4 n=1 Tax=Triplophysa rosa TaxID=992332 RepID=A0A9W7WUB2_TRIRA|nr:membrane-associated ring finger C3HC4 4 [Triplophysa rosa]
MLKSRCCVLFGDLKVLLLRPQANTSPMSGQTAPYASHDNNSLRAHRLRHWSTPSTEDAIGQEGPADGSGWTGAVAEEFLKDRRDDRFSFISYAEGTPVCRICFQGPEQVHAILLNNKNVRLGELLSPCRVAGRTQHSIQPCLIRVDSLVEIMDPVTWQAISLTVIEKVQIAAAILGSLFLIASISWLVWSSLSPSAKWQRQDLLFQICYGMYGFMDIVCIALIVHEGPSVFRIFHRWQAVNQQWKVLNYDKKKDSEEKKNTEELSGSQLHQREQTGEEISPSPSSLMVAAGTPAPANTITNTDAAVTLQDSTGSHPTDSDGAALPDQHCPYNLLHLLSHLRAHEPRGPPASSTSNAIKPRELVMRVTTV